MKHTLKNTLPWLVHEMGLFAFLRALVESCTQLLSLDTQQYEIAIILQWGRGVWIPARIRIWGRHNILWRWRFWGAYAHADVQVLVGLWWGLVHGLDQDELQQRCALAGCHGYATLRLVQAARSLTYGCRMRSAVLLVINPPMQSLTQGLEGREGDSDISLLSW